MIEQKINIAELLKDCPSGMELDCVMYDNLYFDSLNADYDGTIGCYTLIDGIKSSIDFSKYGTFNNHKGAKCVIFPKGKTTWEGFHRPFKDGDIIFTHADASKIGVPGHTWISIFEENRNGGVATYVDYCNEDKDFYTYLDDKGLLCMKEDIIQQRLATEEEKQRIFQAIKDNGYKWNEDTKTLEKLVEQRFKVGNRVKRYKDYIIGIVTHIYDDGSYKVEYQSGGISYVSPEYQDEWELVSNKFDINTLKPFDKVLVRDNNAQKWTADLFSLFDKSLIYPYSCVGHYTNQCIPYEGNEYLLGTSNDCNDYYKTWEE